MVSPDFVVSFFHQSEYRMYAFRSSIVRYETHFKLVYFAQALYRRPQGFLSKEVITLRVKVLRPFMCEWTVSPHTEKKIYHVFVFNILTSLMKPVYSPQRENKTSWTNQRNLDSFKHFGPNVLWVSARISHYLICRQTSSRNKQFAPEVASVVYRRPWGMTKVVLSRWESVKRVCQTANWSDNRLWLLRNRMEDD